VIGVARHCTNLCAEPPGHYKRGQPLNIEADVLIKYMEQRPVKPSFELSLEYLFANGY